MKGGRTPGGVFTRYAAALRTLGTLIGVMRLMLTLLVAMPLSAHDYLIVPGVRIGPITPSSTESELRKIFGAAAVRGDVDIGEGVTEPGAEGL